MLHIIQAITVYERSLLHVEIIEYRYSSKKYRVSKLDSGKLSSISLQQVARARPIVCEDVSSVGRSKWVVKRRFC